MMKRTKLNAEECIKGSTILAENTDRNELKKAFLSVVDMLEEVAPGITEKMTVKDFMLFIVEKIDEIYGVSEEEES